MGRSSFMLLHHDGAIALYADKRNGACTLRGKSRKHPEQEAWQRLTSNSVTSLFHVKTQGKASNPHMPLNSQCGPPAYSSTARTQLLDFHAESLQNGTAAFTVCFLLHYGTSFVPLTCNISTKLARNPKMVMKGWDSRMCTDFTAL
jgi:hypothetical protein